LETCSPIETRITDCAFRGIIAAKAVRYITQITARTVYTAVIRTVSQGAATANKITAAAEAVSNIAIIANCSITRNFEILFALRTGTVRAADCALRYSASNASAVAAGCKNEATVATYVRSRAIDARRHIAGDADCTS
jgi:hypothetical protein